MTQSEIDEYGNGEDGDLLIDYEYKASKSMNLRKLTVIGNGQFDAGPHIVRVHEVDASKSKRKDFMLVNGMPLNLESYPVSFDMEQSTKDTYAL
jgi:hypothetical protein